MLELIFFLMLALTMNDPVWGVPKTTHTFINSFKDSVVLMAKAYDMTRSARGHSLRDWGLELVPIFWGRPNSTHGTHRSSSVLRIKA